MEQNKKKKKTAAEFRSAEDNARLARQKAANPTNIDRARELAYQYAGGVTGNAVGTIKGKKKWYSGQNPTQREVVAKIYAETAGNEEERNRLMGIYQQNTKSIGSPVYNPYSEATNYKAIEGLAAYGIDMSKGVTTEWLAQNQHLLNDKRTTLTGYDAAAPIKSGTAAQNAAGWFKELQDAEDTTIEAENEYSILANEVKYWTNLGYSDNAILNKVQEEFSKKYPTLSKMDEKRKEGSALILNRAVNYNGEDTMYGMIWAARNEGGSGNYFADSVMSTLGYGKRYQRDKASEAARDPSNYEGYAPYSLGGTMHSINQRTGTMEYDDAWLNDHRSMLNGTEQEKKDWAAISSAVEADKSRKEELEKFNEMFYDEDGRVARMISNPNKTADEIIAQLQAELEEDYPELAKMEKYRANGGYVDTASTIDFLFPEYAQYIRDAVEERDKAEEEVAEPAEKQSYGFNGFLHSAPGIILTGGISAFAPTNLGKENKDFTKPLDKAIKAAKKSHTELTDMDYANIYLQSRYGVELVEGAELTEAEAEAVKAFAKEYGESKLFKNDRDSRDEASAALDALDTAFAGLVADEGRVIVHDPEAKANAEKVAEEEAIAAEAAAAAAEEAAVEDANKNAYKDSIAYKDFVDAANQQDDEAWRGMQEMTAAPTAHVRDAGSIGMDSSVTAPKPTQTIVPNEDAIAYADMIMGGEWNSHAFSYGLSVTNNPAGVRVEMEEEILGIIRGELTSERGTLGASWYNAFQGLIRPINISGNVNTQNQYGEEVTRFIELNERALSDDLISDEQYVRNLVDLSRNTEILEGMGVVEGNFVDMPDEPGPDGSPSPRAIAWEEARGEAEQLGIYDNINQASAKLESMIDESEKNKAEYEKAVANRNNEIVSKVFAGEPINEAEAILFNKALTTNISGAKNSDNTYADLTEGIDKSMSFKDYKRKGFELAYQIEGAVDPAKGSNKNPKKLAYKAYEEGVSLMAQEMLDAEMRLATACGMTLDEYFAAYPDRRKSADQFMAEAETKYTEVWGEFSKDVLGLRQTNVYLQTGVKVDQESLKEVKETFDDQTMTLGDNIGNAMYDAAGQIDSALSKTAYNIGYMPRSDEEKINRLQKQYNGDASKYRADLEEYLQTPGLSAQVKTSVEEALASEGDIFKFARTINELKALDSIKAQQEVNAVNQQMRSEYMSEYDNFQYKASSAVTSSINLLAASAIGQGVGLSSLAANIVAAGFFEGSEVTFDMYEQTGNATIAWGTGAAVSAVSGVLENKMELRYTNKWLTQATNDLCKAGAIKMAIQDPKQLATLAKNVGLAGVDGLLGAGAEGLQETTQSAATSLATNIAEKASGVGDGKIFSMEDAMTALEEGKMGAVSSIPLQLMFSMGSAYTGAFENTVLDAGGNAIGAQEAILRPEFEGMVINEAIKYETTITAIEEADAQINALGESEEAAAVKEAKENVTKAQEKEAALQAELDAVNESLSAKYAAMEEAEAERVQAMDEGKPFTEDMAKKLINITDDIYQTKEKQQKLVAQHDEAVKETEAAQADYTEKNNVVREAFNNIIEEAKANARALIIEKYSKRGSNAENKAVMAYLDKCAQLEKVKQDVAKVKERIEKAKAMKREVPAATKNYGKLLNMAEKLEVEVAEAKAEMDEAIAAAPETKEIETAFNESFDATADDVMADVAAETVAETESAAEMDEDVVYNEGNADEKRASIAQRVMDRASRGNAKAAVTSMNELLSSNIAETEQLFALAEVGDMATTPEGERTAEAINAAAESLVSKMMDSENEASAEIKNILNSVSEKMWGNRTNEAGTGKADQNPIEIMGKLTKSLGIKYRPGGEMSKNGKRMSSSVMGFYDSLADSVTTRTNVAGDLSTALHEFGHALQNKLEGLVATPQMVSQLSEEVQNTYEGDALNNEAVAEFVVDYMFDRNIAVQKAGEEYVQQFEEMLRNDKKVDYAIKEAAVQIELWRDGDVSSRIASTIKPGDTPVGKNLRKKFGDAMRGLETAVFDLTAPAELVSKDFRQRALYRLQAANRADSLIFKELRDLNNNVVGKGFAERIHDTHATEAEIAEGVRLKLAKHHLARKKNGKPIFAESEFSEADVKKYIAEAEKNKTVVAVADAIGSFWNDLMDNWWVASGMGNKAQLEKLRKMYPDYVPTMRANKNTVKAHGGNSSKFKIMAAKEGGSSLEIIDPLVSIFRMTRQMVQTVTHNQMMQAFHNEFMNGGLGDVATRVSEQYAVQRTDVSGLRKTLAEIEKTGVVDEDLMGDAVAELMNIQEQWHATGQNRKAGVVSGVDENGIRFFYEIHDQGLFDLLSGYSISNSVPRSKFMSSVGKFKNTFTALTTGSNPVFALKNMQRDLQASVNTGTHSLTYADGMVRFVMGMRELIMDTEHAKTWRSMAGVGQTRTSTEMQNEKGIQALRKELTLGKTNRHGDYKQGKTFMKKVMNFLTLSEFNELVEQTSRFIEYRYGKHDLTTPEGRIEAFMASQNVSTNFGTHGASQMIGIANKVIPFMNATLQGLNKDIHIVKDAFSGDKTTRMAAMRKLGKTATNTMLTAALQYAILKWFTKGDEDDEEYALLSQEVRAGNLIIPIGKKATKKIGDKLEGFDNAYVRVPIAQGPLAQSFWALALDTMSNTANYSPMEIDLLEAAKDILRDTIPDGSILKAFNDAKNNVTYYGGAIENSYMQSGSNVTRANDGAPKLFTRIARAANEVGIDTSPAKVQYLFTNYSGIIGKIAVPLLSEGYETGDSGLRARLGNLGNSILSSYTISPASSNDVNAQYKDSEEIVSKIITDAKRGNEMGNIAFNADPDEAYDAAKVLAEEFKDANEEIAGYWEKYNEIDAADLMTPGEKAQKKYDIRMNYIIPREQEAIALFEEFKMEYIDGDKIALSFFKAFFDEKPRIE